MNCRKTFAILLCAAIILGVLPAGAGAARTAPFSDVQPGDWFYDGVLYAYDHGMMNGTGGGHFSPGEDTTRGMLVTILHRLEDAPVVRDAGFTDVPVGKWYTEAVNWGAYTGLMQGLGDGTFAPEAALNREQIITTLYRYAAYLGCDVSASGDLSAYPDADALSAYARGSMAWAVALGLITGTDDSRLAPKGTVTRAQLAVLLMRFCRSTGGEVSWLELEGVYVPGDEDIVLEEGRSSGYLRGILMVYFRQDAEPREIETAAASVSGDVVGRVPGLNLLELKVAADSREELSAMARELMERYAFVRYASWEPVLTEAEGEAVEPNDPWDGDTGGGDWTDGDVDGSNWWLEAIEAPAAWAYNDRLAWMDIGVCDNSFDIEHEDLANRYRFVNKAMEERNQTGFSLLGEPLHEHGTHVAGIIGAEPGNGRGITGLVWNATLCLAPSLTRDKRNRNVMSLGTVVQNVWDLVMADVKVINLSLTCSDRLPTGQSFFERAELDNNGNIFAQLMASLLEEGKDFLVVQCAGNGDRGNNCVDAVNSCLFAAVTENSRTGSETVSIHEILDRIIIVGAAEQYGDLYMCTSFSNYGDRVDICAPGKNIYSIVPADPSSFRFTSGCDSKKGTSQATPIVTGVCAMVWAADLSRSGSEVKEIVCSSWNTWVLPNPKCPDKRAYPMVNARLAVEKALGIGQPEIHYYEVFDPGIYSWEEAERYCEARGGHLATITSREENDHVYWLMRDRGYGSAYFGLSDSAEEGIWTWVTGEKTGYTNWHDGEPNGGNGMENYAMFFSPFTDGTWNDGDFGRNAYNGEQAFICEWETEEAYLHREALQLSPLLGTYQGYYYAPQGQTGLTLEVYQGEKGMEALFIFYNLPGHTNAASGSYRMRVTTEAGRYIFTAVEWIDKPPDYYFVDLEGVLEGDSLTGTVSGGGSTYTFLLYREREEQQVPAENVTLEVFREGQGTAEHCEYGVLTALDGAGNPLWAYSTEKKPYSDWAHVQDIGRWKDRYYFNEFGVIACVELTTGSLLWKAPTEALSFVEDLNGHRGAYIGEDGTIYLCCYYGPSLIVIDKIGNVVAEFGSFYRQNVFPYAIDRVDADTLRICFELGPDNYSLEEKNAVYVSISDLSFWR